MQTVTVDLEEFSRYLISLRAASTTARLQQPGAGVGGVRWTGHRRWSAGALRLVLAVVLVHVEELAILKRIRRKPQLKLLAKPI